MSPWYKAQPLNGFSKKCACNLQVLLEGVQPWEAPERNMPFSSASSFPSCCRWSLRPTQGTKKQTSSRQVPAGPLLLGPTWGDQFTFWHVPSHRNEKPWESSCLRPEKGTWVGPQVHVCGIDACLLQRTLSCILKPGSGSAPPMQSQRGGAPSESMSLLPPLGSWVFFSGLSFITSKRKPPESPRWGCVSMPSMFIYHHYCGGC